MGQAKSDHRDDSIVPARERQAKSPRQAAPGSTEKPAGVLGGGLVASQQGGSTLKSGWASRGAPVETAMKPRRKSTARPSRTRSANSSESSRKTTSPWGTNHERFPHQYIL